jgi:hypothetical protein
MIKTFEDDHWKLVIPMACVAWFSTMLLATEHHALGHILVIVSLVSLLRTRWLSPATENLTTKPPAAQLVQVPVQDAQTAEKPLESLDNPLRWSFLPSDGELRANTQQAISSENESASLKFLVLHRPSHDAAREEGGSYPYSWHFAGRKRVWEVRVQVRFKQLPRGKICFGLEMQPTTGHSKSFAVKQMQRMLLGAIRAAIGNDFYHTPGDDPATTVGEVENPAFIMPLWAVDQFHVADPGQEPDLSSNLDGIGKRRTDGRRAYIDAMNSTIQNLSCDKVYTFCFWGVAQFVDVINWELKGLWPGFKMEAEKLSGDPLVYVSAYDLVGHASETRHVQSRKKYIFKVALWSALKPPSPALLQRVLGVTENAEQSIATKMKSKKRGRVMQKLSKYVRLLCWSG